MVPEQNGEHIVRRGALLPGPVETAASWKAIDLSAAVRYFLFSTKLELPWARQSAIKNAHNQPGQHQKKAEADRDTQTADDAAQNLFRRARSRSTHSLKLRHRGDRPRRLSRTSSAQPLRIPAALRFVMRPRLATGAVFQILARYSEGTATLIKHGLKWKMAFA